ncbi:MAG: cupin domain-containing protein [Anaerolineae bacterium]|nr:cupin domain-containing protein [Anaerolineae bacterium]
MASVIYFLLYDDHFSALHRLLTDEVYHFYLGDPVELLLLHPNGDSQVVILGHDLEAGQHVQFVAPQAPGKVHGCAGRSPGAAGHHHDPGL